MDRSIDAATALMATQHGLAHRAQLRCRGVTDAQVDARVASGSWTAVTDGVVGAAGAPRTDAWSMWRAVLATGVRSDGGERPVAVGGLAAAALLGCAVRFPTEPEVVCARGVWCPRAPGVRVREVSDWRERRFVRQDGLLVTALPDTLVDCAPWLPDADFLALLQDACFANVRLLGRVLTRCHRGSKGSARARRVGSDLARGVDSVLHARGVRALRAAGLAPSACDVEVVAGAGGSDCVYLAGGRAVLAVEFDGDLHRLSRRAFLHDRAKDLALREAGCVTVRFTVEQVDRPARLVDDVRRALASAAASSQLPVPSRTTGVA